MPVWCFFIERRENTTKLQLFFFFCYPDKRRASVDFPSFVANHKLVAMLYTSPFGEKIHLKWLLCDIFSIPFMLRLLRHFWKYPKALDKEQIVKNVS